WFAAAAALAGGIAAVILGFAFVAVFPGVLPTWFLLARARQVVRTRPEALVDADDPDALFVGVVPRQNWGKLMLELSDDMGFLRIDGERQRLLYEGDRERWTIPAASVLSCEVEGFDFGPSAPDGQAAFWVVVLRANVEGRVWEAPLALRPVRLRPVTR